MTNAELFFDQAEIQAELPFEIRPTSIPGVYDIPAPPPDFDPRTATAEELRRAGLPWHRSVINRNPIARELWDRATARRYTPVDETVTTFGPPPDLKLPPHGPRRGPSLDGDYNTWSGAVVMTGTTWTGVQGQWVVPTVSPGEQPAGTSPGGFSGWWMSSWVGLGGWIPTGSNNVLQIGITQTVSTDNKHHAWLWYEWWYEYAPSNKPPYGNSQAVYSFDVKPGDTVSAAVTYFGGKSGQVRMINGRTAKEFTKVVAMPKGANLLGNSAEWIVEVPNGGEPDYALANFTSLTFPYTLANNCESSTPAWAGPSSATLVNMQFSGKDTTPLTSTSLVPAELTITYAG